MLKLKIVLLNLTLVLVVWLSRKVKVLPAARCFWKMAKVINLMSGSDGKIGPLRLVF